MRYVRGVSDDDPILFTGADQDETAEALALAELFEVPTGTVLIAEFDTPDTMFVLIQGSVTVHAQNVVVATLHAGAVLGEIGLFTHAVRTASVIAAEPCVVRRLDRDGFERLREAENAVAARIERRALKQLAQRLRGQVASLQAAAVAAPNLHLPLSREPSAGTLVPMSAAGEVALLGTASAFAVDVRRVLRRIGRDASLLMYARGEVLTDPFEHHRGLRVLLHGSIHGQAQVPGQRAAVRAVRVGDGELFNLCPTIDGQPRALAFVAQTDATLLLLDSSMTAELYAADTMFGSVLRHAMIRSLFAQVNEATSALADVHRSAVESAIGDVDAAVPHAQVVRDDPGGEVWDAWY